MSETAPPDVSVLDTIPGAFWLGAWRTVNAVVWLSSATRDVVERVEMGIGARFGKLEERMSTVHVIVENAGPPEADGRTALVDMNNRLAHTVACGAVVIERGGVLGLALRSAVTGLILAAPKHYRVKVFDSLEPCAPWIADQHEKATALPIEAAGVLQLLKFARKAAK